MKIAQGIRPCGAFIFHKLGKFCENRASDTSLQGVYIPHFDQISVKFSVLGYYTLIVVPMGVKFVLNQLIFAETANFCLLSYLLLSHHQAFC